MEKTTGDWEDPAGVKLGRGNPFPRDKTGKEDGVHASLGRSQE